MKIAYWKIIIIISSGCGIGLVNNGFNHKSISLLDPINEVFTSTHPSGEMEDFLEPMSINLQSALELYNSGVIFLDAREHEEYLAGHIKNAINIPYYDFENFAYQLNNVPKDEAIITYCSGTDCELSIMLAKKLFEQGYKKTFIFFGGWNSWVEAGHPVESIQRQ